MSSVFFINGQEYSGLLKFGHITGEQPEIIYRKYDKFLTILSKELKCKVILIQAPSYSDMQKAFITKEVDMGILNAVSYVNIVQEAEIIPLVRRVIKGSGLYRSYLITHKDSGINSYNDIKNKTIFFQDPCSTTGYLLPRIMFKEHDISISNDINEFIFVGTHDSILLSVLNRSADIGTIASYVYDFADPDIRNKIVVLDKSEPVPLGPFVVRKDLDTELTEKIKNIMLTLDRTEEGRVALRTAGLTGFEEAEDSDYDIIRQIQVSLNLK